MILKASCHLDLSCPCSTVHPDHPGQDPVLEGSLKNYYKNSDAWKQEQQCTSTLDVCENTTMGQAMAIRKRQYVRAINKHVLAIMGQGDTK